MVVAELKSLKKNGKPNEPTEAQERWLAAFRELPYEVHRDAYPSEVYVWTPRDWAAIKDVLA